MPPTQCPDFERPVIALLGLPVDAIGLSQAMAGLHRAREQQAQCFLSTPNLNFAIQSQRDAAFRDSVCRSNMSVADGMPLVWLARCMGLPVRERVPGSSLFEALLHTKGTPWRVFFMGGPPGVAQQANMALNAQGSGMQAVGWIDPGKMNAQSMQRTDWVDEINAAQPDFLVVALGAQKGQAWISHHLARLQVPVVSHLGAVVNFVAGTVSRAPRWVQRTGLEWLWRIKEEPHLWRRYRDDAWALLGVAAFQVGPLVLYGLWQRMAGWVQTRRPCQVICNSAGGVFRVTLQGGATHEHWAPMRQAFRQAWASGLDVEVDASALTQVDAQWVALCLLLDTTLRDAGRCFSLTGLPALQRRVLSWHAAGHLTP
ncbi:MAG: hypothetical protein RJB34_1628 [Pseudomonadota bacterium]|jgi:N-acetylglucosaminyldiphosphoundecaprenol N-acetyl-beta-D-mannosaminyltransferase